MHVLWTVDRIGLSRVFGLEMYEYKVGTRETQFRGLAEWGRIDAQGW